MTYPPNRIQPASAQAEGCGSALHLYKLEKIHLLQTSDLPSAQLTGGSSVTPDLTVLFVQLVKSSNIYSTVPEVCLPPFDTGKDQLEEVDRRYTFVEQRFTFLRQAHRVQNSESFADRGGWPLVIRQRPVHE